MGEPRNVDSKSTRAGFTGVGLANRYPASQDVPVSGDALAVARALCRAVCWP
ncbi:dsRBD fold-containing protein [Mycolicibacterium sp. BiH015]|uniref:dsRBD fold-containing protein n=1 Tax=Mycolicibacterium sp. BiH015 TaxID=3018808 RepID=UPI003FA554ED